MNRTRSIAVLLAALLPAAAAGCGGPREADAEGAKPAVVMALESGLTDPQRATFYHLAEGSEVIPYAWVRAVYSVRTGRPFLEDPDRFGLIPDPTNPDSLPVGLTAAPTVDTRLFGVKMTGINCAACHVNEITFRGARIRVDGAPSTFEADSFKFDLKASLAYLRDHPKAFLEFMWRLRRDHEPSNPHIPTGIREETRRLAHDAADLPRDAERGARDADRVFRFAIRALEHERRRPAEDMLSGLTVAPAGTAAPAGRLPRGLTYEDVAVAADSLVPDDFAPAASSVVHSDAGLSPAKHVEAVLSDLILTYRLLKARIESFRRILPTQDSTFAGFGRVDAFGVARNSIYPADAVPLTAPVDYPWLWDFVRMENGQPSAWFHYDGNTNSFMQRNMGQAIGVGAVYDSATYISTLNPWAIQSLETIAESITPPQWPAAVFGPVDRTKLALGDSLYRANCLGCHTTDSLGAIFTPDSIGTDRLRLTNFATPMKTGGTFTGTVSVFLDSVAAHAYTIFNVPVDSQVKFNLVAHPVWQTTVRWKARRLHGVWATAPFLHNGSVPTLYDLLQPASQRPVRFGVGGREYDPVKLGLAAVPSPRQWFDTRAPGNHNGGHEFGTNLTPPEKAALLEYLKTF
jgi:hypothetical protein